MRRSDAEAALDDDQWTELARHRSLYATKDWYTTTDHHPTMEPYYVTSHDERGRVRGLIRAFYATAPYSQYYDPAKVFQDVLGTRSAEQWWPCLMVGSRMSTNELLVAGDGGSRAAVNDLADALRAAATERGVPVVSMHMPCRDAHLLQRALGPGAVALRSGDGGELRVEYASVEQYLMSLSSSRRSAVRKEMRRFRAAGWETSTTTLAESWREIAPLIVNVDRKHGVAISADERRAELERQARVLSDRSVVHLCRDGSGAPVACSVLFRHCAGLYARHVGMDYGRTHAFEYFNLLFYLPLGQAIKERTSLIHYGLITDAKRARGVRPTPMCSLLWRSDWPMSEIDERAKAWNAEAPSIGIK